MRTGSCAARLVLAVGWDRLAESLRQSRAITQPSRRAQALDQLAAPIAGLLVGAAISQAPEIVDAAVAVFADQRRSLRVAVGVLRAMPQDDPDDPGWHADSTRSRENTLARLES